MNIENGGRKSNPVHLAQEKKDSYLVSHYETMHELIVWQADVAQQEISAIAGIA